MATNQELIVFLKQSGVLKDPKVEKALLDIPREHFVMPGYEEMAYVDEPLPILGAQTLLQPATVVTLLQELQLNEFDRVLEIGSGTGWMTCLIAKLCARGKVFATETNHELAEATRKNIKKFNLINVEVLEIDGTEGYAAGRPYDKMISSVGLPAIPQPWTEQIKEKGIIVAPVGTMFSQKIIKAEKFKGKMKETVVGEFSFPPAHGKYGFDLNK